MYKFYIVTFVLLGLLLCPVGEEFCTLSEDYEIGIYEFYLTEFVELDSAETIRNGDGWIVRCAIERARSIKKEIGENIEGESFTIYGGKEIVNKIIDKAQASIVKEGKTGDVYCYYLYSGKINARSITVFDRKVNLQIAVSKNEITVGYPIILGSY